MKKFFIPLFLLIILLGIIWWIFQIAEEPRVTNFEECVRAGNPVMESYPRQCRDATGAIFREEAQNIPL